MFSNRYLAVLILPLIAEQFLHISLGLFDTLMVSSLGEASVSGISLVDSISQLFIFVFSAFCTGGAVVSAQYLGNKERAKSCVAAKQLLYTVMLIALVIMVFTLVFQRQLLDLIFGSIEADVMSASLSYFWILAISYPFLALFNTCTALYRAMGNSKTPLLLAFVMNLTNISFNALFIFVLRMGVAGAALGTLVSRAISSIIMLVLVCDRSKAIHIERLWKFEFHRGMVRRILSIGVPSGIENGMFHIGKLLVQGIIASFGTAQIAANAISSNIANLENIPGSAVGMAAVAIVGQCIGANEPAQAKYYSKKLLAIAFLSYIVTVPFFFATLDWMIGLYNVSAEAAEYSAILVGSHVVMATLIWPLAFTLPNFLRAAGDAKYTMVISLASMWIFRVGFSKILGANLAMGVVGVWIAMYIDWACRGVFFIYRFSRGKWLQKRII